MTSVKPTSATNIFSEEAEKATIGSIITNPDAFQMIYSFLKPKDFFLLRHVYIWRAIERLIERSETVDYLTICQELKAVNQLDQVGGAPYLTELITFAPTSSHLEVYAHLVERASIRRDLLMFADDIKTLAQDESRAIEDVTAEADGKFAEVINRTGGQEDEAISSISHRYMDDLERKMNMRQSGQQVITGIPSGLIDLDAITLGFGAGEQIIIAGRPCMGKTALAICVMLNALKEGKRVGFASIEMTRDQVFMRMIAIMTGVSYNDQNSGNVNYDQFRKITDANAWLSGLDKHFFVTDLPEMSPVTLRGKARRWKANHGLDMICVDYLQLMSKDSNDEQERKRQQSREQEVAYFSRSMKGLAKMLNIPSIVLAQLNRGVEERQDKRPVMSDLRDSGQIEQDADKIIFLYRDAVYNDATEFPNQADLIVAKHRNGPTGVASAYFDKRTASFMNAVKRRVDLSEV